MITTVENQQQQLITTFVSNLDIKVSRSLWRRRLTATRFLSLSCVQIICKDGSNLFFQTAVIYTRYLNLLRGKEKVPRAVAPPDRLTSFRVHRQFPVFFKSSDQIGLASYHHKHINKNQSGTFACIANPIWNSSACKTCKTHNKLNVCTIVRIGND